MQTHKKVLAGAAVLAALAAGAIVPTALAQDPDDTAAAERESTREERHAAKRAVFAEALAEELGLDTDTVAEALENVETRLAEEREAAYRSALGERLDAAVEAGTLTQEQADAILEAQAAGVLRGLGGPGRGRHNGSLDGGWGGPHPPEGGPSRSRD